MKKIKLTQNKYALVDNEDYEKLIKYKWFAKKTTYTYYAQRNKSIKNNQKRAIIAMHQEILGKYPGKEIDHKNGNGLNNQKKNLRFATKIENQLNVGKSISNRSGAKGVSWDKSRNKWTAHVTHQKVQLNLGRFDTITEAKKAYRIFVKNNFGEFGRIK